MPAAAAISAGAGAIQAVAGYIQERKAEKKFQKLINSYQPNASIYDYYNKALQRYDANPYTSSLYTAQQDQIKGGTAQGIGALQDRRSAIGGVSSLIRGQNDAMLKAAATAEGQQAQALGQLGQATAMKAQEDKYKFENLANMYAAKAGGGARIMNQGLSNIFSGVDTMGQMDMIDRFYGNRSKNKTSGGASGGW